MTYLKIVKSEESWCLGGRDLKVKAKPLCIRRRFRQLSLIFRMSVRFNLNWILRFDLGHWSDGTMKRATEVKE